MITLPRSLTVLRALHRETHRLILATWGTTQPAALIDLGAGDPVLAVARALADASTLIDRYDRLIEIARHPDPRD